MDMLPASNTSTVNPAVQRLILGPLETQVMEILWACGECTVREVINKLDRTLAYTTVMTTLDRLFRKNLTRRRRHRRAYFYSPRVSCQEWKNQVVRDVVARLLAGPPTSRAVLIACLLEAIGRESLPPALRIEETLRETH